MSPAASTSYRLFLGDDHGLLKVARVQVPGEGAQTHFQLLDVVVDGADFPPAVERSVTRMAKGEVDGRTIIAVARKDGMIDALCIVDEAQEDPSKSAAEGDAEPDATRKRATLLFFIHEDRFLAGKERFVGLRVGKDGITSVTSLGNFRHTPWPSPLFPDPPRTAPLTPSELPSPTTFELPSPLHGLAFNSAPGVLEREDVPSPTYFAYGGLDVPLSIWELERALGGPSPTGESVQNGGRDEEKVEEGAETMNSKQRKRKRQADARRKREELMWGEVWRAKNLPNDSTSLSRPPNTTCVAFLTRPSLPSTPTSSSSATPALRLATGTKEGWVRIYETFGKMNTRKPLKEWKVLRDGGGAIKGLQEGSHEGELFIWDTQSRLYVLDWRTGKVLYHHKDITGAISAVVPLSSIPVAPSSLISNQKVNFVISTSLDRLVRLHSSPPMPLLAPEVALSTNTSSSNGLSKGPKQVGSKPPALRGETLGHVFTGTAPTAAILEGHETAIAADAGQAQRAGKDGYEDESGDEEEMWGALGRVEEGSEGGDENTSDEEEERKEKKRLKEERVKGSGRKRAKAKESGK